MSRAEEFACKYAGFTAPPSRKDYLEDREKCDIYSATLEGYEQGKKDMKDALLGWAKMKKGDIKKVDWDADYYSGIDFMLDELIDKLNSM